MTFHSGGIVPSPGPDSDLMSVVLHHGEPVLRPDVVRELLSSGERLDNWLKEYGITWKPEVNDDGDE